MGNHTATAYREILLSFFMRALFVAAFAVLALVAVEEVLSLYGSTLIAGLYTQGRLIVLSATLFCAVGTLLLRQIRDNGNGAK